MAGGSFGGTVKLTGESEYQKALRGITDNLKVLNSEMKVITSTYDKNNASSNDLQATNQALNKKLDEQKQKVDVLRKALEDSKRETGENSNTTKKWQTELNKAQAEVNETSRKIDENTDTLKKMEKANASNTKELKEFEEQERKAGDSTLKLGDIIKANLISEGIIAGIKGLGSAMAKVGSALIDVGKQAVQSYAPYEQLVGGVDTLFGESSKKVQEYASNAYKTSGMSANEYMETVTSFSASLISSLDGDTAKASEVANRAIIDMSDNANKMGTDISMIQNAYQGFAKQNYTMLDNLKLGYGGTKEEMARLISEASQMTDVQKELGITVAEGDMSFANIANAISVVQKNMGLMGTTASEASGTISGSTGSMKSAWENLVTGISDDNANFGQLVDNLVTSIVGKDGEGGFINNILPRIQTALDGVVKMVVSLTDTLLPQIVTIGTDLILNLANSINENLPALMNSASTILDTLINGIMTLLPTLMPVAVSMIETLVSSILSNLSMILEAGVLMLVSLAEGVASMLPELIPLAINAVLNLVETLLDNIDLIIDAGISLIMGLADGLILALPDLIDRIPIIIDKAVIAITNNLPKLVEAGIQLTAKLAVGLIKALPQLISKIPQIIGSLISGFGNYYSKMGEVGLNLIKGLWEGISNAGAWLRDKISGFFGGVVDSIKDFFGIHSPSKVFSDEIGKNLALGVGEGFGATMSEVSADMQGAIPTEFDTSLNMSASSNSSSTYGYLVTAFKEALKDVKVVMNNREMGAFVIQTVERTVYT